jgi:hypothetical protein
MTSTTDKTVSSEKPGNQSIRDINKETRLLPYYCTWYRIIFTDEMPAADRDTAKKIPGQVPG